MIWIVGALAADITVGTDQPDVSHALAVALPGDRILLPEGTHTDPTWTLDFDVAIEGAGPATVLVGGSGTSVLDVSLDANVQLRDLTISGEGTKRPLYVVDTSTVLGERIELIEGIAPTNRGGALFVFDSASVTLIDSVLTGNQATDGGAVYATGTASVTLIDTQVLDNTATSSRGGAIYSDGSATLTLQGCTVEGNSAPDNGGALYLSNNTATDLADTAFRNNTSDFGGAIHLSGTVSADGLRLEQNDAGTFGSALYVGGNGDYTLHNVYTCQNTGGSTISTSGTPMHFALTNWLSVQDVAPAPTRVAFLNGTASAANFTVVEPESNAGVSVIEGSAYDGVFVDASVESITRNTGQNDVNGHLFDNAPPGSGILALPGNQTGSAGLNANLADCSSAFAAYATENVIDAGYQSVTDLDGSHVDRGHLGGPFLDPGFWGADADGDGVLKHVDCDDDDPTAYPGAPELCNGVDDDCDGQIDDGAPTITSYLDHDGDGYGDPSAPTSACEVPEGYTETHGDCDDASPSIHPGVLELCDGIDNDCDGLSDEGLQQIASYLDLDDDGYGDTDLGIVDCVVPPGYAVLNGDCDDDEPTAYPGAPELCDGIDNDCAAGADDGLTFYDLYEDVDGDGYGTGPVLGNACSVPANQAVEPGDCDDTDAHIYPDATEQCDGIDNDCNGHVDDEITEVAWYTDSDGDGYGGALIGLDCAQLSGGVDVGGDCDDGDPNRHPGADEVCSGVDEDCDGLVDDDDDGLVATLVYPDLDADGFGAGTGEPWCSPPTGYSSVATDCDDTSAQVHPLAAEACVDHLDNDCDGLVDAEDDDFVDTEVELWFDHDGDGFGTDATVFLGCPSEAPPGYVSVGVGVDCDDTAPAVNPFAMETCDGIDNNCDGLTDEIGERFDDLDGDGFGDPDSQAFGCPLAHQVDVGGDCDDTDAHVNPLGVESCDGVDNDCDGQTDVHALDETLVYLDADGDGFGDDGTEFVGCPTGPGTTLTSGDCDDTDEHVHPDATEACDGRDENCNGVVDDGVPIQARYRDHDGDGYGDAATEVLACDLPAGWTTDSDDCDDADATISPAGTEDCIDPADNDCDGLLDADDPDSALPFWPDGDGDGFGDAEGNPVYACEPPAGQVDDATDCDDGDPSVHPGALDAAGDEVDSDCDGEEGQAAGKLGMTCSHGTAGPGWSWVRR